jgi:hypothetical protein
MPSFTKRVQNKLIPCPQSLFFWLCTEAFFVKTLRESAQRCLFVIFKILFYVRPRNTVQSNPPTSRNSAPAKNYANKTFFCRSDRNKIPLCNLTDTINIIVMNFHVPPPPLNHVRGSISPLFPTCHLFNLLFLKGPSHQTIFAKQLYG